MDSFIYINACKTALEEGITPTQTILTISNPGRFPASIPADHVLVLTLHPAGLPSTQEIIHCTAISTTELTVVRGAQGTAPASWPEGTVVGAYLTAEMLAQIAADVNGHAGSGGAAHALASTIAAGFMSAANLVKLNGIQAGATKYQHPITHSPTIIAQDANNRFTTDQEKGNWNAAKNHADSAHAPADAQKNSDILKSEIEAKLTGSLSSHDHPNTVKDNATASLTTGYSVATVASSNVSGTYTPTVSDGNIRFFTLVGDTTLACPSSNGAYSFIVDRSSSLFTLSFSGFSKVTGSVTARHILCTVIRTPGRKLLFADNV